MGTLMEFVANQPFQELSSHAVLYFEERFKIENLSVIERVRLNIILRDLQEKFRHAISLNTGKGAYFDIYQEALLIWLRELYGYDLDVKFMMGYHPLFHKFFMCALPVARWKAHNILNPRDELEPVS